MILPSLHIISNQSPFCTPCSGPTGLSATGPLPLPFPLPDPFIFHTSKRLIPSPPSNLQFTVSFSVRPLFATPFKTVQPFPQHSFPVPCFSPDTYLQPTCHAFYLLMSWVTPSGGRLSEDRVTDSVGALLYLQHPDSTHHR